MTMHRMSSCSLSVVLAAVAGQAPCGVAVLIEKDLVQQNTLQAFGLTHSSTGNAQLSMSPTGALVISNIGSSGLDGVTFPIGDVRGHSMSIDFRDLGALMPGGLVQVFYPYSFGDQTIYVEYPGDGSEGRVGLGECPGGGRVWPTCVTVSILDDGVVVGEKDIVCGETDHFVAGDIGTDTGTGEGVGFRLEQDGWDYVHTISLPVDTLLTIPGGPSAVGDEIRMSVNGLPPGEAPSGPVDVRASNLGGDLEIRSSSLILPGSFSQDDGVVRDFNWLQTKPRISTSGNATMLGLAEGQACQSHPKTWFFPRGTLSPTRAVQVDNLGSSGVDGISVDYIDEAGCDTGRVRCPDGSCADSLALCPAFPLDDRVLFIGGKNAAQPDYLSLSGPGVSAELSATGWTGGAAGASGADLGSMRLSGVQGASDVDVEADFSSLGVTLVRAEVYLDGAFVGFHEVPTQQGPVAMGRMGNHPNVCQMVSGGTTGEEGGPFGYFITTRDVFTLFAGGQQLVGDEIRVLAPSAPAPVQVVSDLHLTGTGLQAFDFRCESIADDDASDVALGTRVRGFGSSVAVSGDEQRLTVSNIGSSGQDGVAIDLEDSTGSSLEFASGGEFTVDSFYDISYYASDHNGCPSCRPVRLATTRFQATTPDRVLVSGSSDDPTVPVEVVLYDADGVVLGSFSMLQTETAQVTEPSGLGIGLSKADSKRGVDPDFPTATLTVHVCHLISDPGGGGGTGSGMGVLSPAGVSYQGVHAIGVGTSLPSAGLPCCSAHVTILKSHDPTGTSSLPADMVFSTFSKKGYDHYMSKSDQGAARVSTQGCGSSSGSTLWRSVTNIGSSGLDGVSMDLSPEACKASGECCDWDCDDDIDWTEMRFDNMNGHGGGGAGDLKLKVVAKKTPGSGGGTGGEATAEAAFVPGPAGPELSVTVTDHNGAVYVYQRAVTLYDENGLPLVSFTYNPGDVQVTRMVVLGPGELDGAYAWSFVDEPNPNTGRIRRRPDLLTAEWDEALSVELPGTGQVFQGVKRCEVELIPLANTVFDFDELVSMDLLWAAAAGETDSYLITEEVVRRGPPPCAPDLNGDGIVDNGDIGAFIGLFLAQDPSVDFNGDGIIDNGDIGAFIAAFLAGC